MCAKRLLCCDVADVRYNVCYFGMCLLEHAVRIGTSINVSVVLLAVLRVVGAARCRWGSQMRQKLCL